MTGTINTMPNNTMGAYTFHCASCVMPICKNKNGKDTNKAICAACKAKIPKFKRHNCGCKAIFNAGKRLVLVFFSGSGTYLYTANIANNMDTPVSTNKPDMPMMLTNKGAATKLRANVKPMLMPTIDMARVRTESRIKSDIKAVITPLMAPAPCKARANTNHSIEVAAAAIKLPTTNMVMPM